MRGLEKMTMIKLAQISVENGKTEFKSMKQYVEYFKLGEYIDNRKDEELGFGKLFEKNISGQDSFNNHFICLFYFISHHIH